MPLIQTDTYQWLRDSTPDHKGETSHRMKLMLSFEEMLSLFFYKAHSLLWPEIIIMTRMTVDSSLPPLGARVRRLLFAGNNTINPCMPCPTLPNIWVGLPLSPNTIVLYQKNWLVFKAWKVLGCPGGIRWLCGSSLWSWLPAGWIGCCTWVALICNSDKKNSWQCCPPGCVVPQMTAVSFTVWSTGHHFYSLWGPRGCYRVSDSVLLESPEWHCLGNHC